MSANISIAVDDFETNELLVLFANEHRLTNNKNATLRLTSTDQGIQLHETTTKKSLVYAIDIEKFVRGQKTFPAPKQGAFNQALGRQTKSVIDATGGWGSDALLMCSQGYYVTLLERNSVMALLLTDAMQRLAKTHWAQQHNIPMPKVINVDAIDYLSSYAETIDCIYLDPMFPAKRKKSAATNKNMRLLQEMVGADLDSARLLSTAKQTKAKRIVVKRPNRTQPLGGYDNQPEVQFSSKLVNFDVYFLN